MEIYDFLRHIYTVTEKKKKKNKMSNIRINKDKALQKWQPVLENMGVENADKLDWMSEYAEQHAILENIAYANLANISGMGDVTSAQPSTSFPGSTIDAGSFDGETGSGDYGQQLLPVAMKIAAHTIGLDLVGVKPSPGPKIDLMYIDFEYDNTDDVDGDERPQVWKWNAGSGTDISALRTHLQVILTEFGITEKVGGLSDRVYVALTADGVGDTLTGDLPNSDGADTSEPDVKEGSVEFLGFSRIDGLPMFRSWRQNNTASSNGAWTFDDTQNTFAAISVMANVLNTGLEDFTLSSPTSTFGVSTGSIELISALEDHIPGFVSAFTSNDYPMSRGTEELKYPGIIAPRVSTKTIAVGTIEVSSALKRTEIEDIKANTGMDIVQKMESILVNELSQTISKQIVEKVFEMGDINRLSAPIVAGTTTIFDFDVDTYLSAGTGLTGETSHAVQRKLITKLLNASNYIATEGRIGPAQFAVTNGNLGAALQDIAGYTINPMKSSLNSQGQLYPVGTIGHVQVYVDPYMKYNDNRILIGRKNQPDQPGIIFIPYLMAQSISIISEATFAPRMLLRSRYAVGELGWYPQKQYMTIEVTDSAQVLA